MKTQPTKKLVFLTLVSTVFAISILSGTCYIRAAGQLSAFGGLAPTTTPPSVMLTVTARAYGDVVTLTISHYGGDDLNISDLGVQASDSTGTMENATLAPSSGTLSIGGTITATYTYGANPSGKVITVFIIYNPSNQLLFSSSSILVGGGENQPSVLTNLSISPEYFTLYPGENETFIATLRMGNNNALANKTINWSATAGTLSTSSGTTNSSGWTSVTYTAPQVTSEINLSYENNGGIIDVGVGTIVVIRLWQTASTGYMWQYTVNENVAEVTVFTLKTSLKTFPQEHPVWGYGSSTLLEAESLAWTMFGPWETYRLTISQ